MELRSNRRTVNPPTLTSDPVADGTSHGRSRVRPCSRCLPKTLQLHCLSRIRPCWAFQRGRYFWGTACKYDHVRDPDFIRQACLHHAYGRCAKGDKCTFSHDATDIEALKAGKTRRSEEVPKPDPCAYWRRGKRRNGAACRFAHEEEDDVPLKKGGESFAGEQHAVKDTRYVCLSRPFPGRTSADTNRRPCHAFQLDKCPYGRDCKFAHVDNPNLRRRPCRYFAKGACHRGAACTFSHAAKDIDVPETGGPDAPAFTTRKFERGPQRQEACRHFPRGYCRLGEACPYRHGNVGPGTKDTTSGKRSDGPSDHDDVATSEWEPERQAGKRADDGRAEDD